jgi:hypothetical protein
MYLFTILASPAVPSFKDIYSGQFIGITGYCSGWRKIFFGDGIGAIS